MCCKMSTKKDMDLSEAWGDAYIFQTVQVLISLATDVALVRLLLLHSQSTGIRSGRLGIDNGKCSIAVLM